MTERDAMHSLDDLDNLAKQANDLQLQCAILDMRADYYSVNRNYNALSSSYYDKAIAFAKEFEMPLETAIYMHRKGVYLFIYKKNIPACRYFLFSQERFKAIGFNNVPGMDTYFGHVADFYYSVGDFDNARANLQQALKYQPKVSREHLATINTIGLTYRNSKEFTRALPYFKQALRMATLIRDSVWIGITTGNIGSLYFLQHQYIKALPFIETDYWQSLKYKQTLNAAIAELRLVRITLDAGNLLKAKNQLANVDSLLSTATENVLQYRVEFYKLKAEINEKTGLFAEANIDQEKYNTLKDSLENRDNLVSIERVRLQWELDRSKAQLNSLEMRAEIDAYKRNTVIIGLILVMVISGLIYNRQRLKAIKDKELLWSEKLRLDDDLRNAELALAGYTENLMQKNMLIDQFKTEVEKLKLKFNTEGGAREIDNMMNLHIMTDENWLEFKKRFSKVHPTFFYNLRKQYPHLTSTDIRLLALLKLNLTNREMAGMLGITTDGVKKAKQRLRKKMAIDANLELEDIIKEL